MFVGMYRKFSSDEQAVGLLLVLYVRLLVCCDIYLFVTEVTVN